MIFQVGRQQERKSDARCLFDIVIDQRIIENYFNNDLGIFSRQTWSQTGKASNFPIDAQDCYQLTALSNHAS